MPCVSLSNQLFVQNIAGVYTGVVPGRERGGEGLESYCLNKSFLFCFIYFLGIVHLESLVV